jgi:hypothetical protein
MNFSADAGAKAQQKPTLSPSEAKLLQAFNKQGMHVLPKTGFMGTPITHPTWSTWQLLLKK